MHSCFPSTDRFFGVHCNECKEVITDRVMKAGDRVRAAILLPHKLVNLTFSLLGLSRGLFQMLCVHGQVGARGLLYYSQRQDLLQGRY